MKARLAVLAALVASLFVLAVPANAAKPHRLPPPCTVTTTHVVQYGYVFAGKRHRTVTTTTTDCPGAQHDSTVVFYGPWSKPSFTS